VTELEADQKTNGVRRGLIVGFVTAMSVTSVVALIHGPAVSLALTGDSYQWIQHAHAAVHQPALLFADLDTFLRPSNTWTLAVDRLLWGGFDARGYRTTSLALHGLVALTLALAGRRLGLGEIAAAVVALVWVTSPFTDESAFVVAYRFQPLLLLAWLVLIAVWPRPGVSWSRGRVALAAAAILAAAAAKETWVVTPVLVAALEFDRRKSIRAVVRPVLLVGIAAALYAVVYVIAFPTSKSYYELGPHVLARVPQQLAAFFYLGESRPYELAVTWAGLFSLVVIVLMAVACLRWRVAGTWVALCLFVVPTLPTLLVAFMPQRYLAIPYAAFLLLVALWVGELAERFPRWQQAIRGFAFVTAALVMVAGAAIVQADLGDYRRMAAAHQLLLDEAAEVRAAFAEGRPVLIVRDERAQPLVEILREPQGMPKLPYTRHEDPYGLVDSAALFEWALSEEATRVERIEDWASDCNGTEGAVIVHREGGFADLGVTSDVAAEAARWQAEQRHLRVVRAVPLD
jgi:hypothetical protein